MNQDTIPDSIAVVNGKRYSMWPQFVHRKQEWIGGTLTDLDPETAHASTRITDISFTPNGTDSAMFTVHGENFDCSADVQYLGVEVSRNPVEGRICFGSQWCRFSIQKPTVLPEGMKEFFFTFGQKYRQEEKHPQGGHPDGYFTIVAVDQDQAREEMFRVCGPAWSHQYNHRPRNDRYPFGELRRIIVPKPSAENAESSQHEKTKGE